MADELFEWDERKNGENRRRHDLSFEEAQQAFLDPRRVIARDDRHSHSEQRWFCIGIVGEGIATVRYTMRGERIRLIGAGYWRKGRNIYEKENKIHG